MGLNISTLSIVVPAFNEADNIEKAIQDCHKAVSSLFDGCEIIVVDDGSADATSDIVRGLMNDFPLKLVRFSRNFGKEQAMMAGMSKARGDLVMIVDADGQESLSVIPEMLSKIEQGYDVAFAVRRDRDDEGVLKSRLTSAFYKIVSMGSEVPIVPNARDFRIMKRHVVDAVLSLPERERFTKGLFSWVGFKSIAIEIDMKTRQGGVSKFSFFGLFGLAMTALTSFTAWPLRIWTAVGAFISFLSLAYGVFVVAKTLIWGVDTPGFATLAVAIFFLGGIQLVSIGVLGEYIGRIYTEAKGRPGYIIAEVESSLTVSPVFSEDSPQILEVELETGR